MQSRFSEISGVGVYLPSKRVTNNNLVALGVATSDEWIAERTGIKARRVASPEETTYFMAAKASKSAIKMANAKLERKIDLIIVPTNTSVTNEDSTAGFPCTASNLQADLKDFVRHECGFFDVLTGCSGINYGLAIGDAFIRAGFYNRVLVAGVDKLWGITHLYDRQTSVVLSDGSSAYVLDVAEKPGFLAHKLEGDSTLRNVITSPMLERSPILAPETKILSPTIQMNGREVYKFVKRLIVKTIVEFQEDAQLNPQGISIKDINKIVAHQANLRMLEDAAEKLANDERYKHLGLTKQNVLDMLVITIQDIGNNSVASQGPGTLEILVGEKALPKGSHVLMMGYGAGLSWGINHYIT